MKGHDRRFFSATVLWTGGLVLVPSVVYLFIGPQYDDHWIAWRVVRTASGWIGQFLPYAAFAGGLALSQTRQWASVALRGAVAAIVAFLLLGYVSPLAEYRAAEVRGTDLAARYPTGPDTPENLLALRSVVLANPPARFSFSVEQPLALPPNWLAHLALALVAFPLFAIFSALLGWQAGFLTSGLSPPARRNTRWALGLAGALTFFFVLQFGSSWIRTDPAHSALPGTFGPLIVPILELAVLTLLVRRREARLSAAPPPEAP